MKLKAILLIFSCLFATSITEAQDLLLIKFDKAATMGQANQVRNNIEKGMQIKLKRLKDKQSAGSFIFTTDSVISQSQAIEINKRFSQPGVKVLLVEKANPQQLKSKASVRSSNSNSL